MIKHVVMWRLRGSSADERREQAEKVRAALEALRGNIPGMYKITFLIPIGHRKALLQQSMPN